MADGASLNDVFRFIQLRPQRLVAEASPVLLAADTALAKRLAAADTVPGRTRVADAALGASQVRSVADVPLGTEIAAALAALRGQESASLGDLRQQLPTLDTTRSADGFRARLAALSDTLLAAFYASRGYPADLLLFQDVYRVYHAPAAGDPGLDEPLTQLLSRPLLAPTLPRGEASAPPSPRKEAAPPAPDRSALSAAIAELVRLDRRELLVQPTDRGTARAKSTPFTLTSPARRLVSREAAAVLRERGIDLAETPVDVAAQALLAEKLTLPFRGLPWPHPIVVPQPGVTLPPPPGHALVRPAGVADLLVVKQQIKRYEGGEIAHVENVLAGEKKSRAHRQLDRSEETFLTETETTRTKETELETADRFELNRETSQTIQNDQKVSGGLSLSGKYGPTVEFSSTFSAEASSSQEQASKSSTRFAKDVVSRSLERITERVREVRTRTVIRETEETNLHELDNQTGEPVRGIYQFLDKVYEAQVFNYGIREMFDFMIPEPASFFWYVAQHPTLDVDLPPPPEKLETLCPDASHVTEDNAVPLAAEFGADIEAAPAPYALVETGVKHGDDNASESDQPHSVQRLDITIPPGYRPLRARIRGLALSDENPTIGVTIGSERALWRPASGDRVSMSASYTMAHQPSMYLFLGSEPYSLSSESKLGVSVVAYETNTYSLDITIVAVRTEEALEGWRLATYKKIRTAYDDRVREHDEKVQQLRSEAEAKAERENQLPFGAPPAANLQTVLVELKKHCLSMLTQQRYDAFDATKDGTPPFFDFREAAAEGSYIRFFEQAFEWDQIQYVFYPYFWARKTTWIDRFTRQEVDPVFLEFLRAGSARVVVPVRPGFEVAVTHFLETGMIWGGEGEPPDINSPLYVSIIDEIRERTGAPKGEIPVGEAWNARVPTALVLVRDPSDLPKWKRLSPDGWEWEPDEGP